MRQNLKLKNWLFSLPVAFACIFLIGALPRFFQSKASSTSIEEKDSLSSIENEAMANLPQAQNETPKDSVCPITPSDTAAKEDTLWKAFRRKPSSKAWKAFFDIKYDHKGAYGYYPKFQAKHWQFHNKEIELSGYMYPLTQDKKQTFFMLSFYPIQQCFFCGGAGPESIVEVNSPKGIQLSSKRIKIKGKLTLNTKIPERLFYILDNATSIN
ncbi:hypothetical protein BKI52_14700 [marine bacterium AO1-C]|nr:hypothetical protein BKI52_14700 [marine bacterium AO1-C]